MKTSQIGLDLIKHFESEKLKAYKCPAGLWTIGIGSTFYEDGSKIKPGDKISKDRAKELFLNTLIPFENIVKTKIKVPLKQNQFDALVSHTFNTGGSDTLFRLINEKASLKDIEFWWLNKYITAKGKVLKGLVARRKAELKIYKL